MRATILFFALTILVAAYGVWWVNSRSPVGEGLVQDQEPAREKPAGVREAESYEERRRAWVEAIQAQKKESATRSAAANRQLAAEQARVAYRLKGCYDTGERCRCIGADNQAAQVSVETCRIVASEPQLMQQ